MERTYTSLWTLPNTLAMLAFCVVCGAAVWVWWDHANASAAVLKQEALKPPPLTEVRPAQVATKSQPATPKFPPPDMAAIAADEHVPLRSDATVVDSALWAAVTEGLAARLRREYPQLEVRTGDADPAGHDVIVNATPLGMNDGDPMPVEVSRIPPEAFVGEVVMKTEITAFLQAVRARGCRFQVGTDMLFEQIPAYLEFFGLPTATPEQLRAVARVSYA